MAGFRKGETLLTWIRCIEEEDADPALTESYAKMLDPASGRVDNVLKVHSLHPAGLEAHFSLYRAVMTGTATLRKVDREMLALVVSRLNNCHY